MTTSEARHSSRQYHAMDDRMDMDPPSPQRPGLHPQQQHGPFQSACPAMRASNFHHASMPQNLAPTHYDPVHSSIDDSWTRDQWHAPSFNHSFSHQRLPSLTNSFQSPYHQPPTTAQGPAPFQPQPNQVPFGYQAAHPPAPLAPVPFPGPTTNAPVLFNRQRGGGGAGAAAPAGAPPGGQGPLGTQQPTPGAHSFGPENTIAQAHQQFAHSPDITMLGAFGHASLRPRPSTNQQGSGSFHNFASTWQSQNWAGPQAYSYATGPPIPLAISHPHAPRAPHSSRRHRHSMPRSATITNGDLDDPMSPRSRQTSAFDDRLREAQAFRGSLVTKRVASVKAIKSLKSVPISELPEDEKMCNICYNEFGVETPEKVTETPVRLPGCKHVFGDRCIKTWFEDSNLCPYCREAVESEMRSFMPQGIHGALSTPGANQLRAVLLQNPELLQRIYDDPELVNELILGRMHPSDTHDDLVPPAIQSQERRAPPTNSEEGHRRQRPRRGSWVAVAMQQSHQGVAYLGRSRLIAADSGYRASSQRRSATPPQLVRLGASTGTNLSQMSTRNQAARADTLPPVDPVPQIRALPLFPQRDTRVSEASGPEPSRERTRNYVDEFGSESSSE